MIVEFIEVINFFEVIEKIIETNLTICKRLYKSRKTVVIFFVCPINTRFFTCLDKVYKGSREVYVQHQQ